MPSEVFVHISQGSCTLQDDETKLNKNIIGTSTWERNVLIIIISASFRNPPWLCKNPASSPNLKAAIDPRDLGADFRSF